MTGVEREPVLLPDGSDPDPYPRYAALRAEGGVHLVEEPTGLRRWTFFDYERGRRALADQRMTKDPRAAWDQLLAAGYVTGDPDTDRYVFHLLNCDPPDHTRLRGLVRRAFSPARAAALRPRLEAAAADLLDRVDPTAPIDLISEYALPLAVGVIGELLGVPTDDFAEYRVWASAGLTIPGAATAGMSRAEAYGHMRRFFTDLIEERSADLPGGDDDPDVLTGLLLAREQGDPITEQEIVALLIFLLNTGQEPTVSLVSNGLLALVRHPDQLALLASRPDLLPTAVDELLRYDGSVSLSTLRVAREDIEVEGAVIPAGGIVSIAMNSANRDPARFPDPDRLDVTRSPNPHLAFGHGAHRCLGVPLGRLTGEVALGELLRRHPTPALACAPDELTWRPTRVMRSLTALPVVLSPSP